MTFGKRQLVIAALVVALGAAVYLNWQFSGNDPAAVAGTEESSTKQLGQTTYVNTEVTSSGASKSEGKNEESSKTTDKTKPAAAEDADISGHFADERTKRSQSDAKAVETLSDIIEAASSSENAKKEAVAAAEELASNIKAQSDIESEIKSKGFEDAFVSINNNSCNVLVYGGKLDDASAIAIKDIVNRQAGTAFDKITVSESK